MFIILIPSVVSEVVSLFWFSQKAALIAINTFVALASLTTDDPTRMSHQLIIHHLNAISNLMHFSTC